MVPAALIRPVIVARIQKSQPAFSISGFICADDLNRFRFQYVQSLLASDKGELTALDHEVLQSLHQHELLSSNITDKAARKSSRFFCFPGGLHAGMLWLAGCSLNKVTGWNREGQKSN